MFPIRLVQLMESHADELAQGLMLKLQSSQRCSELFRRVPADELRRRVHEICRNLSDWLMTKTESEIEERYVGLGVRRARQGVPLAEFIWAFTAVKEYLWEHLEKEGLFEEPLEILGEVELFRNLERFFDRAIYFTAVGYQSAGKDEAGPKAGVHTAARR